MEAREFGWIWHSSQFSFGIAVLGAVPISFGLGWWATVSAVLVGLAAGSVVFAPLVRMSMRTGQGDAVSSGAHLGVRGRALTSVVTILITLVFFAIAVWTGASAVLVAGERLVGTPTGSGALAVVLPVVAAGVIVVAIVGAQILLRTYRVVTVVGALVLLTLVVCLAPGFDPGYAGGAYVLDGFWPTWLLAASFAGTLPVSYSTLQGDYGAALAPGTRERAAIAWSGVSMFTSNAVALLVGAMVATMLVGTSESWTVGLAAIVPGWFVPVVVAYGIVGAVPQAALCLYGAGLALQAIRPRWSRTTATALVAVIGIAALYIGTVALDAIDAIAATVPLLMVAVAPWAAIMLVGHRHCRGRYDRAALASSAEPGSRYWYRSGTNPAAMVAFVSGVVAGLLVLDTPLLRGPLAGVAGGVDLSWLVSFVLAGAVHAVLLLRTPVVSMAVEPAR